MAEPSMGVCGSWIGADAVLACCQGLVDPPDPDMLDKAIVLATNLLFRWSGRRFPGLCERVVHPCFGSNSGCAGDGFGAGGWTFWWWDAAIPGWATAFPGAVNSMFPFAGACAGRCDLPNVVLPAPVAAVTEVVIDGVILDPSKYAVENYRKLVRLDGIGFPCTNDRSKDSGPGGDIGTWQIAEGYGRGPGVDGELVAARFACELAKVFCNGEGCQLPQKVQRAVREGLTLEELSNLMYLEKGLTGIREVDMWLQSTNPQGLQRRATIGRLGDRSHDYRTFT